MLMILYGTLAFGSESVNASPFFFPRRLLPSGEAMESLPLGGSASYEPTRT